MRVVSREWTQNMNQFVDKRGYCTLCLEASRRFQIKDNDLPLKAITFCQKQLGSYCCCKNEFKNGNEVEDEDSK